MRFEPLIDRAHLLEAIRTAYAVPASALVFLPLGLGAAWYALHGPGSQRSFLKLWPDLQRVQPAAERRRATLALTRALHDRALGVRLPYPLPTRDGDLWASLAETPFALFPYLPGAPPERWSAALNAALGRTIAAVHRATPALGDVLPPRETFAIAFEPALRRDLDAAAAIGPSARPGLRALRAWAVGRQGDVLHQLDLLHQLQEGERQRSGPAVLCHTDLHDENLLVDAAGGMAVLDWDDAKVAPPEHDLAVAVSGEDPLARLTAVLDAYHRAGGAAPLHADSFAFYLLRHYLEDAAVCLSRLLAADADEREDADRLHGLDAWGVARWSALPTTREVIATALRHSAYGGGRGNGGRDA